MPSFWTYRSSSVFLLHSKIPKYSNSLSRALLSFSMLEGDWSSHFTQLTSKILGIRLRSTSSNSLLPSQPPSIPLHALTLTLCGFCATARGASTDSFIFFQWAILAALASLSASNWGPRCVGPRELVVAASNVGEIVESSSTCWVVPSSIIAVMWMASPHMVVASTMDWPGARLQIEEVLLFFVGRNAPSCKEQTPSQGPNNFQPDDTSM